MPNGASIKAAKLPPYYKEPAAVLKEFCDRMVQASYLVASEFGYRKSFLGFLPDFQKALDEVIRKEGAK